MKKFTKTQAEAASDLAVAYKAYNQERNASLKASSRDEEMSALNGLVVWGRLLHEAQEKTGVVLNSHIAANHEEDRRYFFSKGGNEWLGERAAKRAARVEAEVAQQVSL